MKKKKNQEPAFPRIEAVFNEEDVTVTRGKSGLTKMEYAMVHAIATPNVPTEFSMAALKSHPTWVKIKENNPSAKAEGAILSIFKTQYEMDYLAANIMAEQYWKLYYYEKMFENIEEWESSENVVLRNLFNKSFGKE